MNFWNDTHREIRRRLLAASPKAVSSGNKINQIKCPGCDEASAFIYSEKPNSVMCHRNNKCGMTTLTRHLYPDLFGDFAKRFAPTQENPRATAQAYLEARGLNTVAFDFSQGQLVEDGKSYQTVKIEFSGVTFQRLIDYQGKNKNRLTKYRGKWFETAGASSAEKVFVVEGIFDALALQQSGLPALATLSSSHNPEECFKTGIKYVLAFDNDNAGHKAIKRLSNFLKDKKIEFSVALPPTGSDWNELLSNGNQLAHENIEKTLMECYWRGRLAMACSPQQYFKIYCGNYDEPPQQVFFEFNNQTYKGVWRDPSGEAEREFKAIRMLDCTLKIAYSIEDASIQYESRLQHIIIANSNREGTNKIRFRGADFSALNEFKAKLMQYRLLFFGNGQDLTLLAEYLFQKKPLKIRECPALGYDRISDCYVFNHFLYDANGLCHLLSESGYFQQHRVMPFAGQDKAIGKTAPIDIGQFLHDLHSAYGDKGMLALGFWVASSFSHVVFDRFGFFPFFSKFGDPHCGKSDLTTLLNRIFFVDSEGLTMSSSNTKKGELRAISQKSSMVTALLEGRKEKTRFDYDSILPLYNRNALQVRAQTSNDNQIHELKFTGTLAFVQNVEQFISKPAKERVVSIRFSNDGLESTYDAWKKLKTYSQEQLASVGHYVLSHRHLFESQINKKIDDTADYFKINGVSIDRVAKNHAVCVAGASILLDMADAKCTENLLSFALKSAMSKIETSRTELLLADHFMQMIDDFTENQGVHKDENLLVINMPAAMNHTAEAWNKSELLEQLKMLDNFIEIKTTRVFGKYSPKKCWFFKNEKPGLQSYKPL